MNNYHQYSRYLYTEYDEALPVGRIGRGTHYSILSFLQWNDLNNRPMTSAKIQKIGVIWDEDHDDRIISVIEEALVKNLLSPVKFIGERKGSLSVVVDESSLFGASDKFERAWGRISESADGDHWSFGRSIEGESTGIIHDEQSVIAVYLQNIQNLWGVGMEEYSYVEINPDEKNLEQHAYCLFRDAGQNPLGEVPF